METARRCTLDKYAGIRDRLESKGYQTTLDTFVVGSLGTWDPENDHLISLLGIGRKYGALFKNSAAVTPSPVVTRCGPPVAGGSTSSRVPVNIHLLSTNSP